MLQNLLLSDSSSEEEDDNSLSREQLVDMMRLHKLQRTYQKQFHTDKEVCLLFVCFLCFTDILLNAVNSF